MERDRKVWPPHLGKTECIAARSPTVVDLYSLFCNGFQVVEYHRLVDKLYKRIFDATLSRVKRRSYCLRQYSCQAMLGLPSEETAGTWRCSAASSTLLHATLVEGNLMRPLINLCTTFGVLYKPYQKDTQS